MKSPFRRQLSQSFYPHNFRIIILLLLASLTGARGDFVPIPLTLESFNEDMVVEKSAPRPLLPATTASMETGFANTSWGFFERGYVPYFTSAGLPLAGSRITSEVRGDYEYELPASYQTNNAFLLDSTVGTITARLTVPGSWVGLSFLTCSSSGGNIRYTLHHEDGSNQTGTFSSPNWLNSAGTAYTVAGRVDVVTFSLDALYTPNPRLYAAQVTVSNSTSPITAIDLNFATGTGHHAVFAISGIAVPGEGATPIAISGFNADIVVESTASRSEFLVGFTTASMDEGEHNTKFTWYERGYNPAAPSTGLPAAGTALTNMVAGDYRYVLAASYASNNVVMIEPNGSANLVPSNPPVCSVLSFLGASNRGPVTNGCEVQHADGTKETNWFVVPDWVGSATPAFVAAGRVSVSTKALDGVGESIPRLYTADIALTNSTSPITNIAITHISGDPLGRTAIFAVSGAATNAPAPVPPTLSITRAVGGALTIHSTGPGRLQSTAVLRGVGTIWEDEGAIGTSVNIIPAPDEPARYYRVAVP